MKATTALALLGLAALALILGCEGLIRPTRIVFVSDRDGDNEIFVMNFTGGDLSQITFNAFDDREAMISPDGKEIVFVSDRDGNFEIYVMNYDGTNVRRLTTNGTDDRQPCWSPDSKHIVWTNFNGTGWDIWRMTREGTSTLQLTTVEADNSAPFWGPDHKIYFGSDRSGNFEIWRIDSGAPESGATMMTDNGGYNYFPAASPNNEKIAFISDAGGGGGGEEGVDDLELWIMNIDGSDQTQLTTNGGPNSRPKFTSNSKAIVWELDAGGGNSDIWRVEADGTGEVNLTAHASANSSPSAARR